MEYLSKAEVHFWVLRCLNLYSLNYLINFRPVLFGAPSQLNWCRKRALSSHRLIHSHSLDRLTSDGSLRPPELTMTGHVSSSIGGVPDVGFQLMDPGLSRTTARTFPFRPVVRSVTRGGFDSQTKCFMRWYILLKPCRRRSGRTCPNTETRRSLILVQMLRC